MGRLIFFVCALRGMHVEWTTPRGPLLAAQTRKELSDERPETAWCAGPDGRVTLKLARRERIEALRLVPFHARDFASAHKHGQAAELELVTDEGAFRATLPDLVSQVERENRRPRKDCDGDTCLSADERIRGHMAVVLRFGSYRGDEFVAAPVETSQVTLVLRKIHGSHSEACVSSARLYGENQK